LQESGGGSADELAAAGGDEAFAAYVLAVLGHAEAGPLARLHERRLQLPVYGRAFLARALVAAGKRDLAIVVADELASLVAGSGPAILREGERDLGWYWSSDSRTTALALSALLESNPNHPAVARLADGLLSTRTDGRWDSTQENVYGLLALSQLARVRAHTEVTATVSLGGKALAQHRIKGRVVHVRVPLPAAGTGPLVIEGEGGRLFYAARLRVERPLALAAPADHGLAVERVFLDSQGAPLTEIKVGQVARVRVTVRAKERLAHVAVVDRLPAGVEPVLTRFQPTLKASERGSGRSLWQQGQTAWQREQLHDDRAEVFADVLAAGESQHEYLVRAVAAGTFAMAPATAEAMYRPQVRGQTGAATLVVQP
jgi:uncharacterized protein YfaS (alpha-2-macroglobulin family)